MDIRHVSDALEVSDTQGGNTMQYLTRRADGAYTSALTPIPRATGDRVKVSDYRRKCDHAERYDYGNGVFVCANCGKRFYT